MEQPLYQIEGRDVLFDWLSHKSDPEQRLIMLEWLAALAGDPYAEARRVPGIKLPVFFAIVPVKPPEVMRYLVAEQFRTVRIINIVPLP